MRKIFRSLLVLVFGVFLISSINVKATTPLVEAIDGASIRTQGVQGLRFYARLDESMKANEHGFYLIYGQATVIDLQAALDNAVGDTILHKGKEVYKVPVPGITTENKFSVVLLGIPEAGYLDKITVIPYVVDNNSNIVFVETPVTRSIGQVAIAMAEEELETPPEGIINRLSVVSFDLGYGGLTLDDVIVFRNSVVNKPADPIREGYKFLGWFKEVTLTTEWNFAVDVVAKYKMPLYAKWEEEVVLPVTVEAEFIDHGTNVPAGDITSMFGLDENIFAIHQVNNEAGQNMWMTATELRLYSVRATGEGTELVFEVAEGYKILSIEFTVLANYNPAAEVFVDNVSHNVYSDYGAEILVGELSATTVSIKNIYKDGGSKNIQLRIGGIKITYVGGEDIEPVVKHEVSFNSDGGSVVESQTINEGSKANRPVDPTKEGFDFLGWFIGENEFDFDTLITEDITLVAKWEVIEEDEELLYSIDFEGGTENSYLRNVDTTLGVEGGLNWHIATEITSKSGVLWNYNASQDTNITAEQGLNIARLDGRNETTITSDAISNVTKLVFDAKFYGTRTDSNLKVQIKVGDGEFVDAFTVNLASTFNTFTVNINEENVQIRFVATGERSNLDNIRIYG